MYTIFIFKFLARKCTESDCIRNCNKNTLISDKNNSVENNFLLEKL